MPSPSPAISPDPDRPDLGPATVAGASLATRVLFLFFGTVSATWAPLVPFLKARLALDDRTLGLFIPCISLGGILMMPLGSFLVSRLGCRRVTTVACALVLLAYIPITTISSTVWLAPVLLCFGLCMGAINISLNIQGVFLQKYTGRSLISGFHGCYSAGSIGGAVLITLLLGAGLSPLATILWMGVCMLPLLLVGSPRCLSTVDARASRPRFVLPRGVVALLSAFCFVQFMCEGSIGDWSAIFLMQARGIAPGHAGWGFAAFAAAMALGRLFGDRFVQSMGSVRVLVLGTGLAAVGYVFTAFVPWPWASLLGFACFGLCCSNIAPVIFTLTGRQDKMPLNEALASVNTFGYLGCVLGPLLIGTVAQATSLSVSFCVLALALVAVSFTARRQFGRAS